MMYYCDGIEFPNNFNFVKYKTLSKFLEQPPTTIEFHYDTDFLSKFMFHYTLRHEVVFLYPSSCGSPISTLINKIYDIYLERLGSLDKANFNFYPLRDVANLVVDQNSKSANQKLIFIGSTNHLEIMKGYKKSKVHKLFLTDVL